MKTKNLILTVAIAIVTIAATIGCTTPGGVHVEVSSFRVDTNGFIIIEGLKISGNIATNAP